MTYAAPTIAYTRRDRKAALARAGVTVTDVAERAGVTLQFACHIVRGDLWRSPRAPLVMRAVAEMLGQPVDLLFPGAPRAEERRPGRPRKLT
jgi:hypothetical protein